MEWRMVPKWLLAMHTYSPASSSDTLTIFRVLLKFSNFTFCPGSSPPFLNHLMMGVGLEEKATVGKTRLWLQNSGSCATVHFSNKWHNLIITQYVCVWQCTHSPAAIHSSSSCSSRSTILELSLPDGERKVGVDSATLRSEDVTRGRINTHKWNIHLSLQHDSVSPWIKQPLF